MNIHYKKVRKVVITGDLKEAHKMMDWAYDNGYRIKYRGPKVNASHYCIENTFKVVAEKEI